MTAKEIRSTVCKMAYNFIRVQGMKQSEAMRKAWANVKLADRMGKGIVEFWFVKATTGELRQAHGTTDPHRYHYESRGVGRRGNFSDCVQYWDTDKQGFRMFKTYNLVRVSA